MNNPTDLTSFDRGISPFLQILLPGRAEKVVEFEADPSITERIEALASKSTEGELSDDERIEYEGYVRANHFIAILKRKARQALNQQ